MTNEQPMTSRLDRLRERDAPDLFASETDGQEIATDATAPVETAAVAPPEPAPRPAAPAQPLRAALSRVQAALAPLHPVQDARLSAAVPKLSVNDVLTREIQVAWQEAVVVVLEAAEVSARSGRARPLPDTSGIFITAEGTVLLEARSSTDGDVTALARTLQALLSKTGNVPAGLRLLATAAADAYPTAADLTTALEYFGRPDRQELIRALFDRCAAAPARPSGESQTTEPDRVMAPESAERGRGAAWVLPLAACAVLAVATAAAAWALLSGEPAAAGRARSGLASTQELTKSLGNEIRATLGLEAPQPAASAAAAGVPAEPRDITLRPTAASRRRIGPTIRIPAAAIAGVPAAPESADISATISSLSAPPPAPVAVPGETVVVPATEATVYSPADTDVRPPVLTYPQLLQSALPEIEKQIVNSVELLVGEDGSVERVKMITRPRRMADMMILSGIKNWRFRPASRHGRPVKYLTVMDWTVTP